METEDKQPTQDGNPLEPWVDPALEARIVALVLGEASAFETAELERAMREQPELAVFHRRMQATHGLLGEAHRLDPAAAAGSGNWRLSPERRTKVLGAIRGDASNEGQKAADPADESPAPRPKLEAAADQRSRARRVAVRRLVYQFSGVAAGIAILGFVVFVEMNRFTGFGPSAKSSAPLRLQSESARIDDQSVRQVADEDWMQAPQSEFFDDRTLLAQNGEEATPLFEQEIVRGRALYRSTAPGSQSSSDAWGVTRSVESDSDGLTDAGRPGSSSTGVAPNSGGEARFDTTKLERADRRYSGRLVEEGTSEGLELTRAERAKAPASSTSNLTSDLSGAGGASAAPDDALAINEKADAKGMAQDEFGRKAADIGELEGRRRQWFSLESKRELAAGGEPPPPQEPAVAAAGKPLNQTLGYAIGESADAPAPGGAPPTNAPSQVVTGPAAPTAGPAPAIVAGGIVDELAAELPTLGDVPLVGEAILEGKDGRGAIRLNDSERDGEAGLGGLAGGVRESMEDTPPSDAAASAGSGENDKLAAFNGRSAAPGDRNADFSWQFGLPPTALGIAPDSPAAPPQPAAQGLADRVDHYHVDLDDSRTTETRKSETADVESEGESRTSSDDTYYKRQLAEAIGGREEQPTRGLKSALGDAQVAVEFAELKELAKAAETEGEVALQELREEEKKKSNAEANASVEFDANAVDPFSAEDLVEDQEASLRKAMAETTTADEPFSTFSLHVSDVAFELARAALLGEGRWPEADRVRIEEFVNAFDYGDPTPTVDEKVSCRIEQAVHPFLQERNLLRISMRTAAVGRSDLQPLRLTILLDRSGSMEREDREASVLKAMEALASHVGETDQVTLVAFAREPRLVADRIPGTRAGELVRMVTETPSEGGTNLEEALRTAGELARRQFLAGGLNRIVLLTDGAANLGNASPESLAEMIVNLRQQGIAFDACGVGADGLNDAILEALTRKGDGRYYLLDRPEDADKGFARQLAGALRPAAKNVKVQVAFNPDRVTRHRLAGFEQHLLDKEDFRNDAVDAAEMAAEEAGVAVYQIAVDPHGTGEVGEVSVRFQDTATGRMIERTWTIPFEAAPPRLSQAEPSMLLAGTAALFGEKLRAGEGSPVDLVELSELGPRLRQAFASDARVTELVNMIGTARNLTNQPTR